MDFLTNHLMLTRGTIRMLPHGNILMVPRVITLLCDNNGRLVCTCLCPPYTICTHTHTHIEICIVYTTKYTNSCIYIHELLEFEPKTSWRHPNAFATKLQNFSLVKLVQHFVLSC